MAALPALRFHHHQPPCDTEVRNCDGIDHPRCREDFRNCKRFATAALPPLLGAWNYAALMAATMWGAGGQGLLE
jgi:hypothetical protein